jgi:hypothetical protein
MPRFLTANDVLNRVVLEVGLDTSTDPYADQNTVFKQLRGLLDSAGQELVELYEWVGLRRAWEITTVADQNEYDLPDDFAYMVNQTGWDRTNDLPLGGPLTAQTWTYLQGRDLVNQTIYATFRLGENVLELFPDPPPVGLSLNFEYISRNWVREAGSDTLRDTVGAGNDTILYDPILIIKFLKAKHLEAKGFDSSSARLEFENMFTSRAGRDAGARILSAGGSNRGFPLIHPYRNTGDTGYGVS